MCFLEHLLHLQALSISASELKGKYCFPLFPSWQSDKYYGPCHQPARYNPGIEIGAPLLFSHDGGVMQYEGQSFSHLWSQGRLHSYLISLVIASLLLDHHHSLQQSGAETTHCHLLLWSERVSIPVSSL